MSCLLSLLWPVRVSQMFLVSDDLASFKEEWSGAPQNIPQPGMSDIFPMVILSLLVGGGSGEIME